MMTATRERLHSYIDNIPEYNLPVIEPILSLLAEEYWKPVIETDLTDEERDIIAEGRKELKEHPENFRLWSEVRRELLAKHSLEQVEG